MLRGIKQSRGFISLSTLISTSGVAVGVMVLIVVIGVMTGFSQDLKNKILSVNAHVIVLKRGASVTDYQELAERIRRVPGVVAAAPFIYTQVMFAAPGRISGGVMRALDLETIKAGGPKALQVQKGSFAELAAGGPDDPPRVAIGNEMARNLNLALGDYFNIISPLGTLTPMGRLPRMKPMLVAAIFHTGMYDFDSNLVFISIPRMQQFLGLGDRVTGIEVQVADIYTADKVARAIERKLGPPYYAKDWMRMNSALFSALKLEKVVMFVILTLTVLVAAFGIASTLFMMVMKKTKEIAILMSMGATRRSIMQIFILNGLTIGAIGTVVGLILGLGLCLFLKEYEFIKVPGFVYGLTTIPVQVQVTDVVFIVAAALAISFLATLYPSWQASRLDPVEAIRYE
ncbi:MAG: lipoprotein-releasing ABC transporter permease subunit [Deltaproteobacteria bacterium]|nr:lipoprotein-releasing ABC transporter permease subunit [Deltaproteobacteria bacterium]